MKICKPGHLLNGGFDPKNRFIRADSTFFELLS
jgi:hypothetical protein